MRDNGIFHDWFSIYMCFEKYSISSLIECYPGSPHFSPKIKTDTSYCMTPSHQLNIKLSSAFLKKSL